MRIISGRYKGRRIDPQVSLAVRPTTDFAKEGLFNVLSNLVDFTETSVLDLFSGTGNISFEFISRGCTHVVALDIERRCVDFINHTATKLGMDGLKAVRVNVLVYLRNPYQTFDLIFADPPYQMSGIDQLPNQILNAGMLNEGGLLILEHSEKYNFTEYPLFTQVRQYGKVHFSFFRQTSVGKAD
ncbi:MAG: RsmD family RNA methyltransferase [bacterium]